MADQNASKIGVVTATIIGMNAMIGAGIFAAPAAIGSFVGPAGIVAYLFVIIAVWFLAQSLARVAARFPEEGSFYTYAKQWGGHYVGLLAVGLYFVGLIVAMGVLVQVASGYLQNPFAPTVSKNTLGIGILVALVVLNMFGVVLSELGQKILICTTTFPLIITTIMCFSKMQLSNFTPFMPYGARNVLQATRVVIFGFFGFECASSLFAIVKDPQKNVPRALTYAIIAVGALYLSFVTSLIASTPLELFTSPSVPLPVVLETIFPNSPWILTAIHISILSAVLGTVHSMIWSSSALLNSLLKHIYSITINPRTSVLIVGGGILASFLLFKDAMHLMNLTAACLVTAYMLSIVTLLTIPEEWKGGKNIITIGGMITASVILYFALEGLFQAIA